MGRDRFQARQIESPRPAPASDAGAGQPMPINHTEPNPSYRLLLRHGLRPGRSRLVSPSFPPGLVIPTPSHVIPA